MKSRWWWLAVLALVVGCEEEAEEVEDPEPVAPLEVTAEDTADEPDEAALQARIRELEAQVAERDARLAGTAVPTPVGGTQTVAVPADPNAPAAGETTPASTASSTRSTRRGTAPDPVTTPQGLLGALLGGPNGTNSSGRRGASNEEEEEEEEGDDRGSQGNLRNPVDALLGP